MFDGGLLSLVSYGLERAEVPTPAAFNAHDHFQLSGAVRLAAQQATASTSVEVGSFAGLTALFSAAIFEEHRVSNMLHAVGSGIFGWQNYVKKSPLRSQIKLHLTTSKRMGPWATPSRFLRRLIVAEVFMRSFFRATARQARVTRLAPSEGVG